MSYVILARNPRNDKIIGINVSDEDDSLATFDTEKAAIAVAHEVPICHAWPWIVVEAP